MIPWQEAPILNGKQLMSEFGVKGPALGRLISWQLQWQFQNPLLGEPSEAEVQQRVERVRSLLPAVLASVAQDDWS